MVGFTLLIVLLASLPFLPSTLAGNVTAATKATADLTIGRDIDFFHQRFELAIELSRDEQWDELAKFEEWTGAEHQHYSEEDFALGRERIRKRKEDEARQDAMGHAMAKEKEFLR
ncbi:hypothetical protein NKR19_g698 [Coniochaeta hoffmannii]|uniref:Uncharacterized protein n=1 Tax=Coniochaeta hoffmannii TaxID=91930 RepID=A0AA38W1J2_9PEZI|nr:hypothetical protein NKR19_g698 [Coniochaeta hoffmannii]